MSAGLRRRLLIWVCVAGATGVCLALGFRLFEEWSYRLARGYHVLYLAAAINGYISWVGPLPETFGEFEAYGLYGTDPYHAPVDGWEEESSGPSPFYLAAKLLPDGDNFIVAVEARTDRTPERRGYVILGDPSPHYASDEELAGLLAADDEAREKAGLPGRWSEIPWR